MRKTQAQREAVEQGLVLLRELLDASTTLDRRTHAHVRRLREQGATWEQIGASIGVTKQAASQRWGVRRQRRMQQQQQDG